jgi:hypothetical protein
VKEFDSGYRWWTGVVCQNGRLVGSRMGDQRRDERRDRRQPVGYRCNSRIAVGGECRSQLTVTARAMFPVRSGRNAGLTMHRIRVFGLGGSHLAVRAPRGLGKNRFDFRDLRFRAGDRCAAAADRRATHTCKKYPECQENPNLHIPMILCLAGKENTEFKSMSFEQRP